MGLFDGFGRGEDRAAAPGGDDSPFGDAGTKLVRRLLDVGIDGLGGFDSARQVADVARRRRSDPERAIDDIVADHVRLAAAGGFVTGLGGFVTLPVALPANVAGFYVLATRMAAAMAAVRGYDPLEEGTRAAVLLALVGADAQDVLTKAGYASGGRLAHVAAERLPAPMLMAVNKGVGFRLATQLGRKAFGRLGRGVPLLGGAIGAGLDGLMIRRIADHVRHEFPPRETLRALTAT